MGTAVKLLLIQQCLPSATGEHRCGLLKGIHLVFCFFSYVRGNCEIFTSYLLKLCWLTGASAVATETTGTPPGKN